MQRETAFHFWYVIVAVLGMLALQYFWSRGGAGRAHPLQRVRDLSPGRARSPRSRSRSTISMASSSSRLPTGKRDSSPTRVEPEFAGELAKYGVTFTGVRRSTFLRDLLSWVVPALFFFGALVFPDPPHRRAARRRASWRSARARPRSMSRPTPRSPSTTSPASTRPRTSCKEVVDFLKNPQGYGRLGARIPKGVLLVGPPGTGKTLLARAVAGEAGVPFFSITGSEFVEMFVGVGAARVRDLFEQAREKAPCIIFIDELDALGPRARRLSGSAATTRRSRRSTSCSPSWTASIRASGIVLLAATNRPEILDPGAAARRPLRPPGAGRPARQAAAASQILQRPRQARCKLARRRRSRADRRADARLHRRRPRQPRQRGGAARDAARRDDGRRWSDFTARGRAHRRRAREAQPRAQPAGARGRRLSRDGPRAGGAGAAGHRRRAQGLDHPARHRRARLHHPAPDRGPLPDDARRSSRTRWRCCWAAAPPSSSSSASSRPARPTISPRRPTSRAAWSCATAWTRALGQRRLRAAALAVPRHARRSLRARARLQRRDGARDRRGGARHRRRGVRHGLRDPPAPACGAGAGRAPPARERDADRARA